MDAPVLSHRSSRTTPNGSDYTESDMSDGEISPGAVVPCTSLTNAPPAPALPPTEWPEPSSSSSKLLSESLRKPKASAPAVPPRRRQQPLCQSTSEDESSSSLGSGAEADSEASLRSWAHNVRHASDSTQRKLKNVSQRIAVDSNAALQMLHSMLTANVDKSVKPPTDSTGRKRAMVDSGSQPDVADCKT